MHERGIHQIHQDQDEGQSGDPYALNLADVRGLVRKKIRNRWGLVDWGKAKKLAASCDPPMAMTTVVNFAMGDTRRPHPSTIKRLGAQVKFKMCLVPEDKELPEGTIVL